jgi:hypothetical protein
MARTWLRADWAACAWDDPWPAVADVTGFLRRSVSRRLPGTPTSRAAAAPSARHGEASGA